MLEQIITELKALGWSMDKTVYRWRYGGVKRYVEINLPYIDFYIIDSTHGKVKSYLTITELNVFNTLVRLLTTEI